MFILLQSRIFNVRIQSQLLFHNFLPYIYYLRCAKYGESLTISQMVLEYSSTCQLLSPTLKKEKIKSCLVSKIVFWVPMAKDST